MKKLYYTKEERICTKCNILKPFSEFNWDKRYNIPFSRCKTCFNERCKKYRHSKMGKQTYEKWVNSTKGKSVRHNAHFKWKNANPDQHKAVYYVKNAIRDGRLLRKPCEICGDVKSEGHHTSYKRENWLKVVWLCKKHHISVHFKVKRI
jgi:hypothetical protein